MKVVFHLFRYYLLIIPIKMIFFFLNLKCLFVLLNLQIHLLLIHSNSQSLNNLYTKKICRNFHARLTQVILFYFTLQIRLLFKRAFLVLTHQTLLPLPLLQNLHCSYSFKLFIGSLIYYVWIKNLFTILQLGQK